RSVSRLSRVKPCLPLDRFSGLSARFVKLDHALKRFDEPGFVFDRNFLLSLLHPLTAREQQRFGVSIFLLPEQTASQQNLRVESQPVVRVELAANNQAVARQRFSFCELLFDQKETDQPLNRHHHIRMFTAQKLSADL